MEKYRISFFAVNINARADGSPPRKPQNYRAPTMGNAMLQPTQENERVDSIDVLRGFALLGILIMNIQSFGLIDQKYMNPMAQGPLSAVSYAWWLVAHLFFDSKMMSIFSALFGAGIVLMWERAKEKGRSFAWLHYRRMFWLLVIGLAHAHLLWHGDILVPYAMCGMLVYWLCGWRAGWLLTIGIVFLVVGSALSIFVGLSMPHWPKEQVAEMALDWSPSVEQIAANKTIYLGSWLDQLPHRSQTAFFMETFLFLFVWIWRAGGLMLVGMALFKWEVFQARRSDKFYWAGLFFGFGVGLPLIGFGVYQFEMNDWSLKYSFFQGHQYNYWGSLLVAFGYVCVMMLFHKQQWMNRAISAVGQMALTNYLLQTVICTSFFYGHGLGWFGQLHRTELVFVVVAVWAFQLTVSPIWLNQFRFGPMEWAWRSLSYWKIQPIRRVSKTTAQQN